MIAAGIKAVRAYTKSKIKKTKNFTNTLNAANKMGKAPIFLKHKAKIAASKVGSFVKKEAKDMYNFAKEDPLIAVPAAVTGLGLGLGLNYLTKNTNKKGMNKEINKIQREKKAGKKNTTKDLTNRLARSQRY